MSVSERKHLSTGSYVRFFNVRVLLRLFASFSPGRRVNFIPPWMNKGPRIDAFDRADFSLQRLMRSSYFSVSVIESRILFIYKLLVSRHKLLSTEKAHERNLNDNDDANSLMFGRSGVHLASLAC